MPRSIYSKNYVSSGNMKNELSLGRTKNSDDKGCFRNPGEQRGPELRQWQKRWRRRDIYEKYLGGRFNFTYDCLRVHDTSQTLCQLQRR